MNLNDLETFILVAEIGTFSGAAAQLGVPKSTVSRRVARLEEELGLALLIRSSRSFVLSDDGRALRDRCAPSLRDIADVERDLADSEATPRGRLRIAASIDFSTTNYLAELLADYGERYPEVHVALEVTNHNVDLLEAGIDLGFRSHNGPLPSRDDLVARRLGAVTMAVYASPAYVERAGAPETVGGLADHRTASHSKVTVPGWPPTCDIEADDYRPLAAMLAAGAGIGVLPDFVAAPGLREGRLIQVLPGWELPAATLSLVWLRSRHLTPRLRAFVDLAVERTREPGWFR